MPGGMVSNQRKGRRIARGAAAVAVGAGGGAGAGHVLAEEFRICNRLTAGAADFADELPAAHKAAIDCAVYYHVVTGRADGTFGADAPLLRGQAASLMARAGEIVGLDDPTASNSFD